MAAWLVAGDGLVIGQEVVSRMDGGCLVIGGGLGSGRWVVECGWDQ